MHVEPGYMGLAWVELNIPFRESGSTPSPFKEENYLFELWLIKLTLLFLSRMWFGKAIYSTP